MRCLSGHREVLHQAQGDRRAEDRLATGDAAIVDMDATPSLMTPKFR
jgi:hypothetical protein